MTDGTLWLVVVLVVVVLVIFRYRKTISLKLKGFGVEAELTAEDKDDALSATEASPPAAGERSVSVGGSADGAKIVTGDDNKVE